VQYKQITVNKNIDIAQKTKNLKKISKNI